jgi:hypothetical protein
LTLARGRCQAGAPHPPPKAGELFGPGQPLDATKYFIILPDAVGTGGSSKPSDGLRMKFPAYNYDDMVSAQYRLVTEHLGVKHLRLATVLAINSQDDERNPVELGILDREIKRVKNGPRLPRPDQRADLGTWDDGECAVLEAGTGEGVEDGAGGGADVSGARLSLRA